uniref:K Homology domain-containing protein n=1 Tax=Alexandrium monilatum TaxID=311494 RepID=A0A7S4QVZ7_9DINO|mmetsp:Transcript_84675/g.262133  ORF Transcript_84675/g.262133 Transcript_84675/m.262133 type:complete len:414 (+) Transcript_84675:123-1364(+)
MKRAAEGGDGYGWPSKRGGKGGSSGSSDKGLPKTRYAFKVLLTDGLVVGLLGTRGSVKDEIQNATGAKLVFSNRGDYFPGSHYRVLGIYADDTSCICRTFDWILPKIAELGVEESKNPPKDGPELLGKEPGEYVFRFCVTKRMSSHIIGTGGLNIKQIRSDTGAKVFIDNETHMNHRLCRVIGTPEQILPCLEQANDYVQQDCEEQDYLSGFAGIVNFGEAAARGWAPAPESREPWAAGGGEGREGREGRGVLVPPPKSRSNNEEVGEVTLGTVQEEVDSLCEVLGSFPPGTVQLQYSVSCGLPPDKVGLLIGKAGEFVKYVEEATGTTIDVESGDTAQADTPRAMTIVGQLLNVYTAHAMMLMKLRTTEAREQEEAERKKIQESEDPAVLKARIEELQAQLASVSSQIGMLT